MENEKDAFFVVRKGDVAGVYKNFADCEAQLGTSILDPPVSVYKGYSLSKDSEAYLVSHGLQNALYTIRAADLKEDIFGMLIPCPFQQPASPYAETYQNDANKKRPQEILGSEIKGIDETTSTINKHTKLDIQAECQAQTSNNKSCHLEFDGASKGNPGQAGAGAVLRNDDGSLICRLREGLGIATNNMAEYRAVLLGMKHALGKGYTKIHVKGDSKLVCMQIQGSWKARHENITNLYEEAKKLKNSFLSFHISHVPREYNSEADAQANLAVKLANGEVQEEFE
uniref:RNase H type-1 domain-containing protein n=1 Tax=Salix viminalis TaxID=40686 RepID=A0A6N2NJN9_SALVM